ncbi:alpha 1 4-glycosyltransferase family protein [Euphorbia peplus]|nr:alpha 1 4-glycosyltransferase family protein [Euphorbia peplus]
MLRSLRSRRRPRYGSHLCITISALLLLLSVSLLYGRLSSSPNQNQPYLLHPNHDSDSVTILHQNPLLSDSIETLNGDVSDKIDELDNFEEEKETAGNDEDESLEGDVETSGAQFIKRVSSSGYFIDHVSGSIRRAFNKRSIEDWDYDSNSLSLGFGGEDLGSGVFGSDDVVIDEDVRRKVVEVEGIEDLLLLKVGKRVSPLRKGWGDWFDKKGDFLRRDRMFKSNLEVLNPLSNPLLQDPDGVGVSGLTRGDKAVQKLLFGEFRRTPFVGKRVLKMGGEDGNGGSSREVRISENGSDGRGKSQVGFVSRTGIKRAERRIFDENGKAASHGERNSIGNVLNEDEKSGVVQRDGSVNKLSKNGDLSNEDVGGIELRQVRGVEDSETKVQQRISEEENNIYADGKRWGYFPGLHPHLSFSDFVDSFFSKGKCGMRVFMVWNSPSWKYTVRQQRGLESLLLHHKDACVLILSETIELDFFANSFVKDGYKVAVAMPNLDELLKDTPASVFADVWSDWRKIKFYSTHYSELVRLAALYKYGGIYLDSDIIVLNSLSSLNNTVGFEGELTRSSLNGAVMAFTKNSLFIMECLKEFYTKYDDTLLRWNGADLLTRVARNFLGKEGKSPKQQELKLQPSYIFFPIGSRDITSYFAAPAIDEEKAYQDALFDKIQRESLTFHFWNSLTSSLIPEPGSLAARLIDSSCIRCSDVL